MTASLLLMVAMVGGTAQTDSSFMVHAPPSQIIGWMMANQNEVSASMACKVVERNGDLVRIVKRGGRHSFDFVVREKIVRHWQGGVEYTSRLVESRQGGMAENDIDVTLHPVGGGTIVRVTAKATVYGVPTLHVRIGLSTASRGFRNMMERVFR